MHCVLRTGVLDGGAARAAPAVPRGLPQTTQETQKYAVRSQVQGTEYEVRAQYAMQETYAVRGTQYAVRLLRAVHSWCWSFGPDGSMVHGLEAPGKK
jgi:hypothetical protein